MTEQKSSKKPTQDKERKTLLGWFFSREEPDKDYLPDLKSQWETMNSTERVKFVVGAIVGVALFVGALLLVYLLLSSFVG